ncbi:unnamed protein product [Rotaria socialis]
MATKANTNSNKGKRKLALVIGISKYKNLTKLPNSENDACCMSSALKEIGFTVTLALNLKYDEMKSALKISEDSTEHGDMILFYFAGHGVQWQESNYLLPQDVPHLANVDLNKNAFNAQEYLYALGERKPSTTVFLLDCCRSYHISVSELGEQALNQSDSRLDHFKPMHMPGSLIAFACAPGAGASDGNGHENGLFTKHLLRHITTPNEDIQLILRDVRREVMQESKSKQIPFLSDGLLERNICLYGQSRYKARDFLQISDDDLKLHENIGDGAFGIVYRATWLSTSHIVAVKKLHVNEFSDKATREFFQELSLLHTLRSPYIVNFYGACMEKGKYALVMEYMSLGSLYKMVHEDKLALTWAERLSIALQAAKGINYLHQLQEPIIHRDIKSLNLLLERAYEGYIVKVCDFGVARTLNETARQTNYKPTRVITLPWSAPEILRVEQHTKKSDIYSLGTIYWELAAFNKPYEGHADDVIRASVLAGDRLRIPENTPSRFCAVIKKCWAQNPQDRPSSSEIIQMIEQCIPIEDTPKLSSYRQVSAVPNSRAKPLQSPSQVKLKPPPKLDVAKSPQVKPISAVLKPKMEPSKVSNELKLGM